MFLNLVTTRKNGSATLERLSRTVSPPKATERPKAEMAATVHEKSARSGGLLAGFERMLSAYAEQIFRSLRDEK